MTTYDTRYNDDLADEQAAPMVEPTTFLADDGRELRGTWFRPAGRARGAAVLVPAMATPARFYAGFATWLASAGIATLTFDYRGSVGREEMRAERGDLLRWAGDAASALEAVLDDVADGVPVTWIGHSLGGQVLPFARHDLVDRVLLVASGLGYYKWNAPSVRRRAPLFFRAIVPAAIRVAGYYPGRRLRMLGDVPPNVIRQWSRWCLTPEYYGVDVPNLAARVAELEAPISTLSFTDDELLSVMSHEALEELYAAAPVEAHRVSPADLGLERIGHHGFFRAAMEPAWEQLVLPRLAVA